MVAKAHLDVWKQFEENDLTHSAAHHLLAVHDLRKERGYARVTDVAKYLNITTGSASTNLKSLKSKGLIEEDDNRFLKLSGAGESFARAVIARKEIFLKFLTDVLGVEPKQAEIDACKTEHLLSHDTSERLLAFMQHVSKDKKLLNVIKDLPHPEHCPWKDGDHSAAGNCKVCGDHCLLADC